LPEGCAYEVVAWRKGEAPETARGLAAPTTEKSLSVDLDLLYHQLHQIESSEYYWMVLVVRESPYIRLT
jgi:hypothetical protein